MIMWLAQKRQYNSQYMYMKQIFKSHNSKMNNLDCPISIIFLFGNIWNLIKQPMINKIMVGKV